MPIDVRCKCGKTLEAKDEHAGKRAKCPKCGQVLIIPGTPWPTYDVFISHSADDKPTADAMCATLETNGIRCWIAPRDIVPGKEWGEAIIDGISQCRLMVLVFSSKSNHSPQVSREITCAVAKGLILIPFRIEDVPLSKTMEYFLSSPHWLDALTPPLELHLKRLLVAVAGFLKVLPTPVCNEEPPPYTPAKAKEPQEDRKPWSRTMNSVAAPLLTLISILARGTKPQRLTVVVAVSIPIAFILFLLIIPLQTKDGTLVVGISDPEVTVQVFGENGKLQIERQADNEIIEISVPPGRHRLKVEKSGHVPFTREFLLRSGGKEVIQARLGSPVSYPAIMESSSKAVRTRRAIPARSEPSVPNPTITGSSSITPHDREIAQTQVAPSVLNPSEVVGQKLVGLARQISLFRGHRETITSVAFSPNGKQVLTGSVDHTAILWNTETAEQIRVFFGHTDHIEGVAFNPDGHQILTGGMDKKAILWNADTGERVRAFEGHTGTVHSVAFSPNGNLVLTGAQDSTAILWKADTGEQVRAFRGHSGEVYSVAFSPNGKLVLIGAQDGTATLWNADTGTQVRMFNGNSGEVFSAVFSPDGKQVFTGARNGVAILWDVSSGEQSRVFKGNSGTVFSVRFDRTGKRVLTGDQNSLAILWDVDTGEQLLLFKGHGGWINSVAFSPDGRRVLTGLSGSPKSSVPEYLAILWDADLSAGG